MKTTNQEVASDKRKYFQAKISDIEASGYVYAAEILLISLIHIKEHDISYPANITSEEWKRIVDELIWLCELLIGNEFVQPNEIKRYNESLNLLGKHFRNIWC